MNRLKSYRPVIIVGTIVVAAALVALYIAYRLALRPPADNGSAQDFKVLAGENAPAIARRLESAGLIRNHTAFVTYINLHGLRPRLKAGSYRISPALTAGGVAELIAGGRTVSLRLTIPEGFRLTQITKAAVDAGLNKAAFEAALAAPHTQSFLATKPAGVSLEGYLFPDSYQIAPTSDPATVVEAMLDNFGRRVGQEYTQAFTAQNLTLHQGLTLASMVEREVNIAADRPVVAQIFIKRMKTGMPLGSDVTTEYASDLLGTAFDLNANSPYNTRRFNGLPPGPICSPGLSAMDAVARPASTDYLFFLSGKDGKTYFAKTYAEHQQNIVKYL